ncbi:DUF2079 domain-containing protein [Patescibacteria group bacterium]|nr:DUF2079 domain-containing protein [Patescibacteria group bacterium]
MTNLKQKIPEILKFLFIIGFIILFAYLSFARHDALKSYMNDLGAIDQVIWNTSHGHFFEGSSVMLSQSFDYNYLGAHFGIILFFLTPFYWIWSSPKMLLLIQVVAVALGGLPIYWLAKEKLKSGWAGLVFLLGFLLYPAIQNALLYDFHEVVLAVPLILYAIYFLLKDKRNLFILFAVLACFCQEQIALIFVMIGLYVILVRKQKKFGLIICGSSLLWFILLLAVIMPVFSSTGEPELLQSESGIYFSRYAWLGDSFPQIIRYIFTNPGEIISHFLQMEKLRYLFYLLMPVFGLAVFSPIVLIALPIVAINMLSSIEMPFNLNFYHSAILTPMIFWAAIVALKKNFGDNKKYTAFFLVMVLLASLVTNYLFTLTPWAKDYSGDDFAVTEHSKKIEEIKTIIPDQASLSVQHNLGSHFTQRRDIYRFPLALHQAEYVLLDFTNPYRNNSDQYFKFDYAVQLSRDKWVNLTTDVFNNPEYGVRYFQDGYLIFQRGYSRDLNDQVFAEWLKLLAGGERL